MTKGDLIVGLDIGTTKVCAIIGEIGEEEQLEIVGVGSSSSAGVRRGVVVNLDATVKSVAKAIKEAELMAGVEVKSVYAGIAGNHIKGINNNGVVVVSSRGSGGEIRETDVKRVIDTAKGVSIPADREIIHVVPQQYIIDGQEGIKDPAGMSGVRLEAEVHIITGSITSIQNIIKGINQAGYEVEDIVFKPLAASYATLTKDEKDLGVVLVDIGGGTSDMVIFVEGSIWHTEVLPIGGENITRDISVGLRTPMLEAEEIKKKHGCALSSLISDDETIEVPSVGGRKSRSLPRQVLVEIIEPRMEEIFSRINRQIRMTGYENLISSGIVLVGGTSILPGTAELAEKVFDLPVRIGEPVGVKGLIDVVSSPLYATGVGLVLYGRDQNEEDGREKSIFDKIGRAFKGLTDKVKEYF